MPVSLPFRRAAVALGASLLAGCVSDAAVVDRQASADHVADKAVVVVSASHDGAFNGAARYTLDGDTRNPVQIESAAGALQLPIKNHFRDRYGHVYVLDVAPGRHCFTSWRASSPNRFSKETGPLQPLCFEVARGDVLYLGDLHLKVTFGIGLVLRQRIPSSAYATVQDGAAHDIPIAEASNPAIAGKVRSALLPLGPWGSGGAPGPASADFGAQ